MGGWCQPEWRFAFRRLSIFRLLSLSALRLLSLKFLKVSLFLLDEFSFLAHT